PQTAPATRLRDFETTPSPRPHTPFQNAVPNSPDKYLRPGYKPAPYALRPRNPLVKGWISSWARPVAPASEPRGRSCGLCQAVLSKIRQPTACEAASAPHRNSVLWKRSTLSRADDRKRPDCRKIR